MGQSSISEWGEKVGHVGMFGKEIHIELVFCCCLFFFLYVFGVYIMHKWSWFSFATARTF